MRNMREKAFIFGTIFIVSNRLQLLGDQMDPRLTVKQWLFLAGITQCVSDAPTLSELAARIGSSRQNVKKMAVLLESRGFVAIERDDRDARVLRLVLTDACKQHFKRREGVEDAFIEDVLGGLTPDDLTAMCRGLGVIEANILRAMNRRAEER